MDTILNIATYLLDHWPAILAYLGGGSAIALLVQAIKRKWKLDERLKVFLVDAKKVIFLLPTLFSAIFAAADAIINNGTVAAQWIPQAAHIMPVLMVVAMAVHRFALSGTWKRIEDLFTDARKQRENYTTPAGPVEPVRFE
jgi:hypothetical protein